MVYCPFGSDRCLCCDIKSIGQCFDVAKLLEVRKQYTLAHVLHVCLYRVETTLVVDYIKVVTSLSSTHGSQQPIKLSKSIAN